MTSAPCACGRGPLALKGKGGITLNVADQGGEGEVSQYGFCISWGPRSPRIAGRALAGPALPARPPHPHCIGCAPSSPLIDCAPLSPFMLSMVHVGMKRGVMQG